MSDVREPIRKQFDSCPYPEIAIDESPAWDENSLYLHNLQTARYFRDQRHTTTEGRTILEAGCGSGYNALILALANPGARIVGVDMSENSVQIARQRLQHHGFNNCEFRVMKLEDLPQLDTQFDYINCDEVLYLLPEPAAGLRAMKSVLKPDGVIRANLHSRMQRNIIFQAQEVFRMLGLFDQNPAAKEADAVRQTMESLHDAVNMKQPWNSERAAQDQWIFSNYLIQGDRGYTIPEMFAFLKQADLEFISMVQWQTWNLRGLFKGIPEFLAVKLGELSIPQRLHLFDLLHPVHRLLDFWCGHPSPETLIPPDRWSDADWDHAVVALHPQLKTEARKQELLRCIAAQESFLLNQGLTEFDPVWIESTLAACLLPLWDGPQKMAALAERWLRIRPVNPATLEPSAPADAEQAIRGLLIELEYPAFVMVDRSAR